MRDASEFVKARDFLLRHRTDYPHAVRHFQWPKLEHFNWALDYFDPMAAGNQTPALCVVDESGTGTTRSFAQLSECSSQAANYLRALGVRRGDRVLVMLGNEVPLWECFLAACKLGAVVVPATTLLDTGDLRDRLERGAVRHVIAGAAYAGKFPQGCYTRVSVGGRVEGWHAFEDAAGQDTSFTPDGATRAGDPLLLYFTSGTTAKPKLVLHSHQSYPVGHLSTMYWIGLQPGDLHWNISSPGWAKHAWSCWFAPWNAGAAVFAYNYARFHARSILEMLAGRPITTLCAPPTVWRMLVLEDLEKYAVRLREAVSAGEPLNAEVIDRVRAAWGITVRDGFGQTETTAIAGNPPGQEVKPGSMGRPLPGYQVELLDGEICLNLADPPVGLMQGYGDGGAVPAEGGCYHTGDLASCDDEGYITYIGRADDVFKSSDYRISPFELESVLVRHEAVAEAAVVGSPDPIRHTIPKAFVLLAPGYQPGPELARALFEFVRRNVAPYKRIRLLEFTDLPKTISGKIRRVELRRSPKGVEYREEDR